MSVKNFNKATAAFAMLNVGNLGPAIAEGVLNDLQVKYEAAIVAEVSSGGGCIVVVQDDDGNTVVNRPLAGADGSVRVYSGVQAAVQAARRGGVRSVSVDLAAKPGTAGDPIKALIARHKSAVKEAAAVAKAKADIQAKIASATALHWDTAADGSPEAAEWADYQRRIATVTSYDTAMQALVASLASSLTDAGIDPATYQPV